MGVQNEIIEEEKKEPVAETETPKESFVADPPARLRDEAVELQAVRIAALRPMGKDSGTDVLPSFGIDISKEGKKGTDKPVGADKGKPEPKTFGTSGALQAVRAAAENGKPILALSLSKAGLSGSDKGKVEQLKDDYNVVMIDKAAAQAKMSQGIETKQFWALANLMGAEGDTNNIKDGFAGVFDGKDFDDKSPKTGLKADLKSNDQTAMLDQLLAKKQAEDGKDTKDSEEAKDSKEVIDSKDGKESKEASDVKPSHQVSDKIRSLFSDGKVLPSGFDFFNFHQSPASDPDALAHLDTDADLGPDIGGGGVVDKADGDVADPQIKDKPGEPLPGEKPLEPGKEPEKETEVTEPLKEAKLDKVKFSTEDAVEAFKLAKENNLPVIVYKGADFCGNCPRVSSEIDKLAKKLESGDPTQAVVLKLNWEKQQELHRTQPNSELSKLVDQLMPPNRSSFPDVKVFNPNEPSKPLPDSRGYGGDMSFLNSLVDTGKAHMDKLKEGKPADKLPNKSPDKLPEPEKVIQKEKTELPLDRSFEPAEPDRQSREGQPRPDAGTEALKPADGKVSDSWLQDQPQHEQLEKKLDTEKKAEKVKLDQIKFAEKDLAKAVALAKENNLPLVVYTGANFCSYCPAASAKIDKIADGLAKEDSTRAVVVKITSETANALASGNNENGRMLREIMSHGSMVPRLSVYNPNDLSRPVGNRTIGNVDQASLQKHIDSSINTAMSKSSSDAGSGSRTSRSARPESENLYTEESLPEALKIAAENAVPLISLTSEQVNPNLRKAFEYLNEKKLAAAVEISRAKSGDMMRQGLETKHFSALQSILRSSKDSQAASVSSYAAPGGGTSGLKLQQSSQPKSAGEMMQFLKNSGVKFQDKAQERQLMSILEGKPPGSDLSAEKEVANMFQAKDADEALKVLKEARDKNLPIVVHADTSICENDTCRMDSLSPAIALENDGKALFLKLPTGGLKLDDNADPQLKAINDLFKVDPDHQVKKTELDLHAFKLNQESGKWEETDMPSVKPKKPSTFLFNTDSLFNKKLFMPR